MYNIILLIALTSQFNDDFSMIPHENVDFGAFAYKSEAPPPYFPAQQLPEDFFGPVVKKEEPILHIKTDKFGKRWQHIDENVLNKFITDKNKEPFTAVDKFGQTWNHQDKKVLDDHIKRQNDYYDSLYNNHQSYVQQQFCIGFT